MREIRNYLSWSVTLLLLVSGLYLLGMQSRIYHRAYRQLSSIAVHDSIAVDTGE